MLQNSWLSRWTLQRYSRSFSQRPNLSWFTARKWLDRAKVHRDGPIGKARSHVPSLQRGIQRYQGQLYLTLNKSGKNAPMRLRPDFRAAVSLKNRLHRESGKEIAEPISPQQYRIWHSSSSDSWWDTSKSWWSSWLIRRGRFILFCYSWFRLQLMAIHCNRRGVYTGTPHTSFFSCALHTFHNVYHTTWLKNVFVRITPYPWSSMMSGWLIVCSFSVPRLVPFRVSLLFLALLFPLLLVLCTLSWTSSSKWTTPRQLTRALPPTEESRPWQNSPSHRSFLTISTSRRPPKSSSRSNPATKTRCPRTCVTRNSTMRPSGKRSLHHCSFRSEKNQRTEDKLITLLKKVCCYLSPFLCVTQERGDPRSTEKPSREMENETKKILLERQKEQILANF